MIRPYLLAETNWKHLKDANIELALLPWGATEAHNYHLPYGTDVYEADYVAAESARKAHEQNANIIVLPTVPFGVNTGQSDIYLDINLNPSTQLAILADIIEVLDRQGIKKLMVLNTHGGNDFKTLLRELGLKFPEMFLCTINWFQTLDKTKYFEHMGDHADEMETSVMLKLQPDLVLEKTHWGEGKEKKHRIAEVQEPWLWVERKWSKVTEDTGIGNPALSTAEKGETFLKDSTDKIAQAMIKICDMNISDMYES